MVRKKKSGITVAIGDVFAIPLGENQFGYGQVVGGGHPKIYVIYHLLAESHPDINDIVSNKIIYFTHTVDVPIEDGDWVLIGNTDVPKGIVFPEYIVDTSSGYHVTDYQGNILRIATESEKENLNTHSSFSPSVLEKATKAHFGLGEWYPYFDKIKYKY
ncbi:Imm26 family immunity protein [Cohnella yongneupensis]|uniref:Imm26 family immunity protein n=1 Tax=Cohnella yongneupensis TaxID=425006 RepID=A0ABW0QX71_9BACL